MSKGGEEVEFKFLVDGPEAFEALRRVVGDAPLGAPLRQVNHFYDTSGHDLAHAELALRLREQAGTWILTAKGPRDAATEESLSVRPEEEATISEERALSILEGEASPLAALKELVGESTLFVSIDRARAGRALRRVGSFENVRTSLGPVSLSAGSENWRVVFELDRTLFPGNRTDHEIEVEVEGVKQAEAAKKALCGLLERAEIAWQPGTSKARRFLAALRG